MLILNSIIGLFLIITLTNFFLVRKPNARETMVTASVGVLVPLRNEAENVKALLHSLKQQSGASHLHFYLLDDSSTDRTHSLLELETAGDKRFTIISGKSLGADWLGKPFALQQLFESATEEILVTVDADVRLEPYAIANSVKLMNEIHADFLSPYPRQIAHSWSERLIQPLLQWSWFFTLPLRIAERSKRPSMAVANGQFFLVRRSALARIDGFILIKSEVIDDVALARVLISHGFSGGVADGSELAHCRMYNNWREVKAGYGKSLRKAFPNSFIAILAGAFLFATCLAPVILAIMGNVWGWLGYFLILISRVLTAIKTRGRIFDSLLHPISIAVLIYLSLYSWRNRGSVQWKGRTV